MKGTLPRHIKGRDGAPTLGRLVTDDGFACVTLERSENGEFPCIPAGTYTVTLGFHHPGNPKGYPCPVINDVPGRSHIHIHVANRASELRGCPAVGERESKDGQSIEQSKVAFARMMAHFDGKYPFELTVVDP